MKEERKPVVTNTGSRSAAEAAIGISKGDRNVPWESVVRNDGIKQWDGTNPQAGACAPEQQRKRARS